MSLPNIELANQLLSFMHAVPHLWSWEMLVAMFDANEEHIEYRGPEGNEITFFFEVLEHDCDENGEYLHLGAHVCDTRSGKVLGSAYIPLCGSILLRGNGVVEFSPVGNGAACAAANKSFQEPT